MKAALALLCGGLLLCSGCRSGKASSESADRTGLSPVQYFSSIQASCAPPVGWRAASLKRGSLHSHQMWVSPSRHTAYGVIHFVIPVPAGPNLVLWAFLDQMKRAEGDATLISQRWDPNLRGLRFVAQGGPYTIRTNLLLRGFEGWAVYAGTLRDEPVESDELKLAERARDRTSVDHATD